MIMFVLTYLLGSRFQDSLWEGIGLFALAVFVVALANAVRVVARNYLRQVIAEMDRAAPSLLWATILPGPAYRAAVRRQAAETSGDVFPARRTVLETMTPTLGDVVRRKLQLNPHAPGEPGAPRAPEHQGLFAPGSANAARWNRMRGAR